VDPGKTFRGDLVGDGVAGAFSVLTAPTACGEIFLGVGFGGATCGCWACPGSIVVADRRTEKTQVRYVSLQLSSHAIRLKRLAPSFGPYCNEHATTQAVCLVLQLAIAFLCA